MHPFHLQAAYLLAWADVTARRLARSERGAATTETVIITAIFAALALAVGAIIVAKVTGKAESIPTDAPAGG
jgi:Flp pilus assembly pilin Flp